MKILFMTMRLSMLKIMQLILPFSWQPSTLSQKKTVLTLFHTKNEYINLIMHHNSREQLHNNYLCLQFISHMIITLLVVITELYIVKSILF